MPVTVGQINSTVEVAPTTASTGQQSPAGQEPPLAPSWHERGRYRSVEAVECEARERTAGEGYGARSAYGAR